MKNKLLSVILVFAVFGGYQFYGESGPVHAQHEGHQAAKPKAEQSSPSASVYYCPMHPSYISDRPGDCPICNMKLIKKKEAEHEEKAMTGSGEKDEGFYVNLEKQQVIGVKAEEVIYRPLSKIIRTVGRVAFDPELYKAQQEYIEALKTQESVQESGQDTVIRRADALVEAAKLKLKLQGLDIAQIDELQKTKENDPSLLISSSESKFTWVYATIYEYEFEWIRLGQEAEIYAASYPGKTFKGTIVAIDPVFDAMTRTVRARIKVENPDSLLKPDMYVDVQLPSDLGAHLAVPREAIMDSGVRKIVFLALGSGRFKPVEVKTGVSSEDYVQVLEGLNEGDRVIVSGNFLMDSESKLKAALEGAGHQHGQ